MSVFRKRGFQAHKKEDKRIKEEKAKRSNGLWRFFLKDGEEDIPVRFLTEEPILFYEHSIKSPDGKYNNETCTGDDCVLCAGGNRASYKGAWLIVDGREYTYKKDGKDVTGKDQLRIYSRGATDIAKLDRLSTKYGLTNRPYFVTKTGSGTSTSYELDRGEESELTPKELANLLAKLPEKYKNHAQVDEMETLYDIVEDCIHGDVIDVDTSSDDDDEAEDDDSIDEGVRSTSTSKKPLAKKKKPLIKKKK